MHVVACDDDASTRYVIRRLLLQSTGCQVTECADGVECLTALKKDDVDLLILDIEMPNLGGLEVLETVRRSAAHQALPVIVLTAERREEVVSRLLQLGVLGYVLKPLRSERLMPLVDRVKRSVRARVRPPADIDAIRLHPDNPALLVDGDSDYRQHFISYAEKFGPVVSAETGLDGLAQFKRTPVNLVFIGGDLGLVGAELLVQKLRAMRVEQPLRIVSIHDARSSFAPGADDELPRSWVADEHRVEMRRFLRISGPLDRVSSLVGGIGDVLINAATQVFGMMLDSPVVAADLPSYTSEISAAVGLDIRKEMAVTVDVHMSRPDARRIAGRMMLSESDRLTDEDVHASVEELASLLVGRLHARLGERSVDSECRSPTSQSFEPRPVDCPEETLGMRMLFRVPAVEGTFAVVVRASRLSGKQEAAA